MEVTNILQMKTYELTDEEKDHIIKTCLGREGLELMKTFMSAEEETWKTKKKAEYIYIYL